VAGGAVVALLAYAVLGRPSLNGDVIHALIWGRDLASGTLPAYAEGPTPHPLTNAVAALLSVLGPAGAYHASEVLALVFVGALVTSVALLGRVLFSLPVGLLAGALLLTDYGTAWRAMAGFYDVPALALGTAALAAVVARRPLLLPAALLALAGLIRPEYWLFSGVLGLYAVWRRESVIVLVVCAVAPALWVLSDWAITGEPLWSLTHTQDLAEEIGRRRGLGEAPDAFVDQLRALTSRVVLVLGVVGAALALAIRRESGLALVGVIAAGGFTYLLIGAAELSLIDRYLLPSAIALTLLASYAALGWLTDRAQLPRPVWVAVAAVSVLGMLATVPNRLHDLDRIADDNDRRVGIIDDLRHVAASSEGCEPVHVPYPRGIMRPTIAHVLGLTPFDVLAFDDDAGSGSFGGPRDELTARSVRGVDSAPVLVGAGPGAPAGDTAHWLVTRASC
jgi:hypothetical protein